MAKHRQELSTSKKISQYPPSHDIVDMEVDCVLCSTRLYVPLNALDPVLASLRRVGAAILICHACGQAQLISGQLPHSARPHD